MKKNIAVIYGGYSSEHEISIKSGQYVASILDRNLFNVYEILITKKNWTIFGTSHEVNKADFSVTIDNQKITFDCVVNLIHGSPGENGILQSYFDLLEIPYTGCNAFVSALTFNKYFCNKYLKNFGINISPSILIKQNENYQEKLVDFINTFGLPVFVKPSDGGSSFGTSKVKERKDLINAIEQAFKHSNYVMIEKFVKGREFTCGIVGIDSIWPLSIVEIRSKKEFFDYDSKYNPELNEEIIPAPINSELTDKLQKTATYIYEILDCYGIVRMDFILDEDSQEFYFLEVNTIPGMTAQSIVPKMLKHDNINITDLYTKLIFKAIERSKFRQ